MTKSLTCRYTGRVVVGPFVCTDDADIDWDDNECPECGATNDEDCTLPDGDSLSPYVHVQREA